MKHIHIYHFVRRLYHLIFHRPAPAKDRLLFVFAGRAEAWPGLARSFYNTYPGFAATIQYCNQVLLENNGAEILSYFEGPEDDRYFQDESKFTCITAIQIATVNLYKEQGYFPNAVMGVSMGEPAAAYAAGALSMEETLKIAASYMSIHKVENMDYAFLFLNLPFNAALEVCKRLPVWAEIIYEDSPSAVLIACHKEDLHQLDIALQAKQIAYKRVSGKTYVPYHTSLIQKHEALLKEFYKDFELRPLQCDYYSPTLGRCLPKHTILPPDYWYHLAYTPVRFNTTLQAVVNDGYKLFLMVGPPAISDRQFTAVPLDAARVVLAVFQKGAEEITHYQSVNAALSKRTFEKTITAHTNAHTVFGDFKNQFNSTAITSGVAYEYLRKQGPIHYLPVHQSWLVLNYDDVDSVLKQPALFSSSLLKEYDPILLGADPEQHKIIRGILQPLFSPAVIAGLGKFTALTADNLLDQLSTKDKFDFVQDFSNPLSLLVLCHFFGLSDEDASSMLRYTGQDYNDKMYWQRLEEYFVAHFNTCVLIREDSLWGKLREMVAKEQFSFADAISLLKIIWTAGMATTSALISAVIHTVLTNRSLADQLYNDERLVAKCIEECLRLQTPLTAIYRVTTEPVELAGQQLPANTTVLLHLRSAMTDPDHFDDPQTFSVTRPAKRHLAFGAGIHQCIGMGIARAEANSVFGIVLKKLPGLRAYTVSEPHYLTNSELQPMLSLIVKKNPDENER